MTTAEKKEIIDNMASRLSKKVTEYDDCLREDQTFEVTKKLRIEIKELTQDIENLKQKITDDEITC